MMINAINIINHLFVQSNHIIQLTEYIQLLRNIIPNW